MKWLEGALKHYMVDFSSRMRDIKDALARDTAAAKGPGDTDSRTDDQSSGTELEEREALLDELVDIVSSIDYARDLHKIGGLAVLLELLDSPHPSLRWRAAEVVATCVANNPPVQQWFLEGGVLPKLVALAGPAQPDAVRAKALLALSGLVRHFGPGLQAFRQAGGIPSLVAGLACPDPRVSRKAMTTMSYVLTQHRSDCAAAESQGALVPLLAALNAGGGGGSSQEASELRQAALGVLLQLAAYPATWAAVRDASGLKARLVALEGAHAALPVEEREAQEEELGLLQRLAAQLAAAAPPPLLPDEGDHVSVEAFEEAGRELTMTVNEPPAAGGRPGVVTGLGAGAAEAPGEAPGPPLLLGPP